ncbi:helix-turn-helix domain-containing protein [Bacillus paralicheniformis]|uniref:helix-turn-helix domain-containing protein n=1 Tax=Bacillus paralicheniformis TaxID=1648923 RepID=UPI002DBE092A|nr:helix-turn-helix domain-containing protein [Bacillus paralicheniformis]MEC1866730.1 helix-turn-helix domain-containing protein [Bacillus paralicheniformis]
MQTLREFETFETVSEMDEYISKVLAHVELKKTERELLWLLAGHSVKFVGVSFLKLQSIADKLGVSKRTAQRALKALSELGIIKRVRTLRPSRGGFGASITQICPVDLSTREEAPESTPESTQEPSGKSETFSFKSFFKDIKYIRQPKELDYSFLSEFVPQEFIDTAKPFISPEEVYSAWGKAQVIAKRVAPDVVEVLEPAIRAFKASVLAYKTKRIKKSFGAYFWGALEGVFSVEQRRANAGRGLLSWNWLED